MIRKYKFSLRQTLFIGLVAGVGFSGCKKFLDINQNPNNPEVVDPSLLLPTTQAAISQVVGNSFQVFGSMYAQYWTQNPQSSQYKTIDQYLSKNTDFDNPWLNIYRVALVNSDLILKSNQQLQATKGIAYLMKAYGFQLATDAFGDVPLTQALQGSNINPNPKYEAQKVVYDSIFAYINKALVLLHRQGAASPGAQDMIFQGDTTKWIAFANTLKLRAYLRLSKADPVNAASGIRALYATNPAPTFLTVDASIKYTSTGGNENPFYNEAASPTLGKTQNVVASSTAVNAFNANSDPRLPLLYDLLPPAVNNLVSIPQGSFANYVGKSVSPPSALTGGNAKKPASATAPVKLLSAAESYFLQAEAVSRGWTNSSGDVIALYKAGISASFTATGAGDPTGYIASPAGLPALATNQLQAIITQKYFAMCGFQGFEAWTEWRRTGYPTFLVVSVGAPAPTSPLPERLLYPNSEQTTNANYPGTVSYSTPVWWAK
ncbi:SusD/RagB family nutrient-binding outer membrane lipoprotein [Mucilaginibacter paludis]|uniref:SusD/RagB family nutrient-binding outer membrane lipoprotein n=1 Tax=Mucilaginibacter paludis DSM 18603 TaxID=714943 RepID=H1YIU3_9SPHI|nr:SusD/RagB family nutrient-binding outer membrane lipoprotein [Mucilaginibacter paludis]EHQ27638.1 hypothetical protein Mucpa_3540 [Mucilaginibacter paludis DSM 18603]